MCICEQHGLVQADATYQHNYHDTAITPEATNLSLCRRVGKKSKRKSKANSGIRKALFYYRCRVSLKHLTMKVPDKIFKEVLYT